MRPCLICLTEPAQIPADHNPQERQDCPVCGMENISRDAERCPQCDADMTCFRVLDALPDETVPGGSDLPESPASLSHGICKPGSDSGMQALSATPAPSKLRNSMPAIMMFLLGLIIVLTLFQFYRFKKLERLVADQKAELTKSLQGLMKDTRETGKATSEVPSLPARETAGSQAKPLSPPSGNAGPEQDQSKTEAPQPANSEESRIPPKPEPPPDSEFWVYDAGEGDTLWDIAEMYYGSGHYYPVLMEHNPNIRIYEIGNGVRLRILENSRLAKQIYRKIVVKEKDHLYWYYTVAEGDTFRSVINKFYRIKDVEKHLSGLDPDDEMQAGKRIKILLQ